MKKVQRTIDANFNRAKEGLRVCEDICRFVYGKKDFTQRWKKIRHTLTQIVSELTIEKIVLARDIKGDIGKKTIPAELERKHVGDIFYANSQRVKESIRVLEEFSKLINARLSGPLKNLRYQVYALEKEIIKKCKIVSHPRS